MAIKIEIKLFLEKPLIEVEYDMARLMLWISETNRVKNLAKGELQITISRTNGLTKIIAIFSQNDKHLLRGVEGALILVLQLLNLELILIYFL
jgi:hypothetical protein